MGNNSTDALEAFMEDYLSRCSVVGGEIITPGRKKKAQEEFDPEAGGHRLFTAPNKCFVCGGNHGSTGLPCPKMKAYSLTGKPDQKRGQ